MKNQLIVQTLQSHPDSKTCKLLLKEYFQSERPYEINYLRLSELLKAEEEYVRIFALLAIAQLSTDQKCDLEKIYASLISVADDWSKKVITFGLIPAFVTLQNNAGPFLNEKAKERNGYHETPILQRVYFESRAKSLTKSASEDHLREFLDVIEKELDSFDLDVQQGLVSAINTVGQNNIQLIQEYIEKWISSKNPLIFHIIKEVFERKMGKVINPLFKEESIKAITAIELERARQISERFSTDSSKEKVIYEEIVVSTLLHPLYVPMLPFSWGANPYRGCYHACEYCYGRNSHEYLGHTKEEFERIIYIKINAADALKKQLSSLRWQRQKNKLVNLGTVTDAYQPIDEKYELTRKILEVMHQFQNPVTITTKSSLVVRDIDILKSMGRNTDVVISLPSLDQSFLDKIERRATPVKERLQAILELKKAGITVGVLMIPIFPYINDSETEMNHLAKILAEHGVDYVIPDILNQRGDSRYRVTDFLSKHYPELLNQYNSLYTRGEGNIYVNKEYQKKIFDFLMKTCLPQYGLNDYSKMIKGKWD